MKLKLSDYASIAEIFGAIAIVVSLYFVGTELSEGNREARAATTQATLDLAIAFNRELLQYPDIWEKVMNNEEPADNVERRRAIVLFNTMMTLNENRFHMGQSGYLEYSQDSLHGVIGLDIYDVWRSSPGAAAHSADFLQYVDQLRQEAVGD